MTLEIGERMALVGPNGSGKTTFIKLLCRLYDPTEGSILLNSVDIRKYDYQEYMQLFSVVFQDFQIFSFVLGEYVAGSGQVERERAIDAIRRGGLAELGLPLFRCHRSYMVNIAQVTGIEKDAAVLADGGRIPVSRRMYHGLYPFFQQRRK